MVSYRLLCPATRIGNVIGKVGVCCTDPMLVKSLRQSLTTTAINLLLMNCAQSMQACPASTVPCTAQGGAAITRLREETGATIKVEQAKLGCPDRLIHVSSPDAAEQPMCRAQRALLALHARLQDLDASHSQEGCCIVRPRSTHAQPGPSMMPPRQCPSSRSLWEARCAFGASAWADGRYLSTQV